MVREYILVPLVISVAEPSEVVIPSWEEMVMNDLVPYCKAHNLDWSYRDIRAGSFTQFDGRHWTGEEEDGC